MSIKEIVRNMGREVRVGICALKHKDTPCLCKALLLLAIVYFFSPIDLIPDFIPILGRIDDIIIIPLLLYFAYFMTPEHVLKECREPFIK